jgi:hypothetical protein
MNAGIKDWPSTLVTDPNGPWLGPCPYNGSMITGVWMLEMGKLNMAAEDAWNPFDIAWASMLG